MNERSVDELHELRRRLDSLVYERTFREWGSQKARLYQQLTARELELIAARQGETEPPRRPVPSPA